MKINKLLILLLFFFNINVKLYSKTYEVKNNSPSASTPESFPYYLEHVSPGDTITSKSSYTITLTKPLELNTDNVTIDFTSEKKVTLEITKNIAGSAFTVNSDKCTINYLNVISKISSATATNGAGIYISGNNTTLNNCTIKDTTANAFGAGVYIKGIGTNINNCTITGNTSTSGSGGGIYVHGAGTNISGCTITSNTAKLGSGGGIYVDASKASIKDCTITGATNSTASSNGAIFIADSAAEIDIINCIIKSCNASIGGGIFIAAKETNITDCIVINCSASIGGGIFIAAKGTNITRCIIESCTARTAGGTFIADSSTKVSIIACTIKNCSTATTGGGIYIGADNTIITNNSIYENKAFEKGSNIYVNSILNSILGNNIYSPGSGDSIVFAPGANNGQEAPTITSATLYYNEDKTVNLTVTGKSASPVDGKSTLMQFFYNNTANSTNGSGQEFIIGANHKVSYLDSTYTATFNNIPAPKFNEPIYISATATSNNGTYNYINYTDLGDSSKFSSTIQATICPKLTITACSPGPRCNSQKTVTLTSSLRTKGRPIANTATFTYQWYKDGVKIMQATNRTYKFTITPETSGNYSLIASSENCGSITSNTIAINYM